MLTTMVVIRILVGLIQAMLRITAEALRAGLSLALIPLLAVALLVTLAFLGFSGLGTFAIFRRRRKRAAKE